MKDKKIYIQFWNADIDKFEWVEFFTSEIDDLMKAGIVDFDSLGYAMDDKNAFELALASIYEHQGPMSCERFLNTYLNNTDREIRISC